MRSFAAQVLLALAAVACGAREPRSPTLAQLQATETPYVALPRGGLVTAGQPTAAQFEQLAQLGVTRVICLRPATEQGTGWEEEKAKLLGVHFERLPIAGATDLTPDNARRLAAAMAEAPHATTMVCCARSNRVGALLALKSFHVDGQSAADALAFGKAAGLAGLEPKVVELLK